MPFHVWSAKMPDVNVNDPPSARRDERLEDFNRKELARVGDDPAFEILNPDGPQTLHIRLDRSVVSVTADIAHSVDRRHPA
jgi:hypothetical protein